MTACEKCWSDAWRQTRGGGKSQPDRYMELLEERKDNPCTPEQQRGDSEEGRKSEMQAEGPAGSA